MQLKVLSQEGNNMRADQKIKRSNIVIQKVEEEISGVPVPTEGCTGE